MGAADSNGIYQYDGSDQVTPIHTLLNLGMASVSARIKATPQIVANTTARTAYASGKTVNSANPLIVWRGDAAVGRKLEYTINGTDWFYYSDSAEDTGWVDLSSSLLSGFSASYFQVRQIGATTEIRGTLTGSFPAGNTNFTSAIPTQYRPGRNAWGTAYSSSRNFSVYCSPGGIITIWNDSGVTVSAPQFTLRYFVG